MQLISLNIWGGHLTEPLLDFFHRNQKIDIFCLQEVYHQATEKISDEDRYVNLNIFADIQQQLPTHQGFFRPVVNGIYGNAIFINKKYPILSEGESLIHQNPNYHGRGPTHSRNLHWVTYRHQDKHFMVINLHGLWNGLGKTDTPERIMQAQTIKSFADAFTLPLILCGDFNLRQDTQSIKIIETKLHNLIRHYGIGSTRTRYYEKEERLADYIFTSLGIGVESFRVLPEQVSDHAPLFLEFI